MTDDAMKRAFETHWSGNEQQPRTEKAWSRFDFSAGWNARDAHHYAEVHELREALKSVLFEDGNKPETERIADRVKARMLLDEEGDDNVG